MEDPPDICNNYTYGETKNDDRTTIGPASNQDDLQTNEKTNEKGPRTEMGTVKRKE